MNLDENFPEVNEEPLTFEISAALLMKMSEGQVDHSLGDVLKWVHANCTCLDIVQDWSRYSSTIVFSSREQFLDFCTRFPELMRGNISETK